MFRRGLRGCGEPGHAGIYAALKALNLEPFTEVIVGPVTGPGGLMPVPLSNLIPVIADAAPNRYNTGPEEVEALLTPLTSAISVPHIAGEPADIDGVVEVARRHGIPVNDDCAQAHGSTLHGRMLGTFGDVGVFSTSFGKHHSTGGQGAAVSPATNSCMRLSAEPPTGASPSSCPRERPT